MALFCLECDKHVPEPDGEKCPKCGAPVVDIVQFIPEKKDEEKE